MNGHQIRVMIVDDQQLVRMGFRLILEAEDDIAVVGEAADGEAAIEMVDRARPDVVLMDVEMPRLDGLAATRAIVARDHAPDVVILTTFDRDDYVFEALRAGAAGFLLKNAPPEDLIDAVRCVAGGAGLLAPEVTRRVIARFASAVPDDRLAERLRGLTERELDVLRLIARGGSNAEIAAELILGEATVKTHVSNVLAKLGLRDRVHAVVFAYESGLISPGA